MSIRLSNCAGPGHQRWLKALSFLSALWLAISLRAQTNGIPGGNLPLLTNAGGVLHLTLEQQRSHYHAHLRGIMTYVDPNGDYGFLQDTTAGVAVFWSSTNRPKPIAGHLVEVTGTVFTNVYSPTLGDAVIRDIGPSAYPPPRQAHFEDLYRGLDDCQWVELKGEVRSASYDNSFLVLEVTLNDHPVKVSIVSTNRVNAEGWVEASIEVRGVACGSFNNKGQFITAELLSPSLDQARVMMPSHSDPYTFPITPLGILGHNSATMPGSRIHLHGVVTLFSPGKSLFLNDGNESIEVRTTQSAGIEVGDVVDVIGFYGRTESGLVIEESNIRRLSGGPPPKPISVTYEDLFTGRFDDMLVTLPARVLEWRHNPAGRSVSLQSTNGIFTARLEGASQIDEMPVGSVVKVTGVCRVTTDRNLDVQSVQLDLRSPADLVLLTRPAWWTTRKIEWVLGAWLVFGLFVMAWAWALTRTKRTLEASVAARTDELRRSEERFRRLAVCLPVGILETDLAGRCEYVNPRWTAISGRAISSDTHWTTAIHVEDRKQVAAAWSDAISAGKDWSGEFRLVRPDGEVRWVNCLASPAATGPEESSGCVAAFEDITQRKEASAKLESVHQQLVQTSRLAGMAEVATSVLHNVGNVLNSINISSGVLSEKIRSSKAPNLAKAAALMKSNEHNLPGFFANDPKGRQLPGYLANLAERLTGEQQEMLHELGALVSNIDHIKEIVAMQQSYGKVSGFLEKIPLSNLVEDALRMNAAALERHRIDIRREFGEVPPILVDKHKVLQIMVNLIRNARFACDESGKEEKHITLRVTLNGNNMAKVLVIDNGIGIPKENLTRIFGHGFTTRKDGHGFGLHSGALAAKEMGGSLAVHSDGPGLGATFTLELPMKPVTAG